MIGPCHAADAASMAKAALPNNTDTIISSSKSRYLRRTPLYFFIFFTSNDVPPLTPIFGI